MPRPRSPATFETKLSSIAWHHISIECVCSHQALVPVAPALARLGPDARVRDMLDLVRCNWCRARQVKAARIVYVGAFDSAMGGAPATDVLLPKAGRS